MAAHCRTKCAKSCSRCKPLHTAGKRIARVFRPFKARCVHFYACTALSVVYGKGAVKAATGRAAGCCASSLAHPAVRHAAGKREKPLWCFSTAAFYPADMGADLFSRAVSSPVSSALTSLTTVFGMGTGGPSPSSVPIGHMRTQYSKQKRQENLSLLCGRRPIFPGRLQPSIFGTDELNYRVRNGNGWTLTVIGTH